MEQNQNSNAWYKTLLTPQTFFYLIGAVVATVIFWYRTQESWAKGKEVEDKVNRQYQVQREMNDKTAKEIEEIKQTLKYMEGYEQAKKDYHVKP